MTKISNKNNYKKNVTFKNKNKKMQKTLEGGGEGEEETIIVLSWNILWMAMDGINEDEPRQKGKIHTPQRDFGKHCATEVVDGLNICARNVKNTIDDLAEEYDFVALQEASQWDKIFEKSTKLKGMGYLHYRFGKTNLVTFYNKKKYRLIAFKTDFISKIIDITKKTYNNRPYHVLYLQHIKSKEHYIFINLHLPHEINREDVKRGLSKNMDTFFRLNKDDGNISETFSTHPTEENRNNTQAYFQTQRDKDNQTTPISMTWPEQKYNIIVAGDFNDTGEHMFWRSLKPLQYYNTDGQNLLDIKVKLKEEPPPTCCSLNFDNPSDNKYTSIGDYILVNSTLNVKKIDAPILTIPTSDHLPFIIHLSPTYSKEDDATDLDLIKPPGAEHETAIIPAAAAIPEAAIPEAGLETSLVLDNTFITEIKNLQDCVPETIHILAIPGDGNCLFSSLLTGLIRLNPDPAIKEFEDIPINEARNGDVETFVKQHVHKFRSIIVDYIDVFVSLDDELFFTIMHATIKEAPITSKVINYIKQLYPNIDTDEKYIKTYIKNLNSETNKEIIKNIYITEMRENAAYGDQTILKIFGIITQINVVIFVHSDKKQPIAAIYGNFCYNGIWLYYEHNIHYKVIFPINLTNSKYKFKDDTLRTKIPDAYGDVSIKKIQYITYNNYEDILAKTTEIEDRVDQVANPTPANPTPVPVKPANPTPASVPVKPAKPASAKPASAKPTPASAKPTPVPVKPAKPAQANPQGQETALRRAGASRVSSGQAPTHLEVSGSQAPTQVERQIQAPTQGQSEKVERQSEEQIGEASTKVERQGDGGEANQNIKESESNSGNMFVIPLMGVVLALAITFLVKK
jgi:endonuclease/exonuclease/phosphatase family metal-dependent hydrolase